MRLSTAVFPLLLGCAPSLVFPAIGEPSTNDAPQVHTEVVVPDAVVPDAGQPSEVSVMEDAGNAQEAASPDVGGADDAVDVVIRDAVDVVFAADTQDAETGSTDTPDVPDVRDARDVTDVGDVSDTPDAQDATDVVDVPVVPMDLGPLPCLPGLGRCGGAECLNLSTNAANCGGCGNACPTRPHAPATCSGGACILVCDPGTLNCDGNLTNGCETTPATDVLNCGACGMACPSLPHTVPSMCVGGVCSFGCGVGYANCDGLVSNGCEISTATDPSNCGACGRACGAGQTCAGGVCLCPSGQPPCGGSCPNLATDNDNCGACGMACVPGQGCCNGVCQNLLSDRFNCGTCGTRCPSPTTCNSGSCGCTGGRIVCGTVCVDASSDRNNCGWCGHMCYGIAPRCVASHCTA